MKHISMLLTLSLILVVVEAMGQTKTGGRNFTAESNSTATEKLVTTDFRSFAPVSRCTARRLAGDYAITFNGNVTGVGPVATLGVISVDGNGSFTISDTSSFNGLIVNRVGAGPINVDPDCTGNATVTYTVGQPGRSATFNFVILEGGREILLISTSAGAVVTGSAKALHPGASR